MSSGYVLVAANDAHYLELAVSAACSLRVNDTKPVALLISGGLQVPAKYFPLFDHIIAFDPPAPYNGDFLRRFVLEKYTPFERVMHVDADCLLIGERIQKFWDRFDGLPFGVLATLHKTGKCYRDQIDIDAIVEARIAPGVYVTNWGVFYFRNSGENEVLARGRALIEAHLSGKSAQRLTYLSRPGQLSDEPIWGIGLAQCDVAIPGIDYADMLQVTSPSTSDHAFDYATGRFSVTKGGHRGVTGQFYHYAAMNPLDGYLNGVAHYRSRMGINLPHLMTTSGQVLAGSDWQGRVAEIIDRLYEDGRPKLKFVPS